MNAKETATGKRGVMLEPLTFTGSTIVLFMHIIQELEMIHSHGGVCINEDGTSNRKLLNEQHTLLVKRIVESCLEIVQAADTDGVIYECANPHEIARKLAVRAAYTLHPDGELDD